MKQIKKVIILLSFVLCMSGCSPTVEPDITNISTEQTMMESAKDVIIETKYIAEKYRDIYQMAYEDKILGSLEVTKKIIAQLGACGYTAVDMDNEVDMVHAESVENFCDKVEKGQDADLMILMVLNSGGFCRFDFHTSNGSVNIKSYSLSWIGTDQQVDVIDDFKSYTWKYTDYGYLIFEDYHPPGYDGPSGHTAIRVKSLDEACREYNRKYIKPIGYGYNNMFATEWSEENFGTLNFYDLYELIYHEKYGYPKRVESNMIGDTYEIPKKEFEDVITSYIRIDSETLQSKTVYYKERATYHYRQRGLYDCYFPTYPEPEVIDYHRNEDGTITLTVNAVWDWENNDTAFRHEVVVRPMEGGGVQYVSNHIL